MKCPGCERKIGFLESLTIINPLSFKCEKCNNYLSLDRSSIRAYILILVVITITAFIGFFILSSKNLLNKNILIPLVPSILAIVLLIHYFFWNRANARLKEDKMSDITNLSC